MAQAGERRYVYVLRSISNPAQRYIGSTANVLARLAAHNDGKVASTARSRPWVVDVAITFRTERMAMRFEKYLKSGSGHEFAKRHFEEGS